MRIGGLIRNSEMMSVEMIAEIAALCLYHYTSPEGLLGILRQGGKPTIWFTQYDSLNDSSEQRNVLEFLHGFCDQLRTEGKLSSEFVDQIKQLEPSNTGYITSKGEPVESKHFPGELVECTMITNEECDTYLCCFSTESDMLPMWNYYTKSTGYAGYSIGFWNWAVNESFERGYELKLRNVVYANDEKRSMWEKILLPMYELYKTGNEDEKAGAIATVQYYLNEWQLIFKEACFSHEQEVRAILKVPKKCRSEGINNISPRKYRASNGYIVPYVEFCCEEDSVFQVTVAPLLEEHLAVQNLEDMLKEYGYQDVTVKSSKVPVRF